MIEGLCVSFETMGMKRIIFLNGHYDNTYAIAYACAMAADYWATRSGTWGESRDGTPEKGEEVSASNDGPDAYRVHS